MWSETEETSERSWSGITESITVQERYCEEALALLAAQQDIERRLLSSCFDLSQMSISENLPSLS